MSEFGRYTRRVICKCGEDMILTTGRKAYNSIVTCDGCGRSLTQDQDIYHCPMGRNKFHENGYDFCTNCGFNTHFVPRILIRKDSDNKLNDDITVTDFVKFVRNLPKQEETKLAFKLIYQSSKGVYIDDEESNQKIFVYHKRLRTQIQRVFNELLCLLLFQELDVEDRRKINLLIFWDRILFSCRRMTKYVLDVHEPRENEKFRKQSFFTKEALDTLDRYKEEVKDGNEVEDDEPINISKPRSNWSMYEGKTIDGGWAYIINLERRSSNGEFQVLSVNTHLKQELGAKIELQPLDGYWHQTCMWDFHFGQQGYRILGVDPEDREITWTFNKDFSIDIQRCVDDYDSDDDEDEIIPKEDPRYMQIMNRQMLNIDVSVQPKSDKQWEYLVDGSERKIFVGKLTCKDEQLMNRLRRDKNNYLNDYYLFFIYTSSSNRSHTRARTPMDGVNYNSFLMQLNNFSKWYCKKKH